MASYRLLNRRDPFSSEIRHGHSKAQMCLMKILRTISTSPPEEISKNPFSPHEREVRALMCGDRGFDIDLNIRLRPPPEFEDFESTPAAVGEGDGEVCDDDSVVGKSDSPVLSVVVSMVEKCSSEAICECDPKEVESLCRSDSIKIVANDNGEESELLEDRSTEVFEIPSARVQSSEANNNGVEIEEQEGNHEHEVVVERDELRGERCLGLLIEAARLISGDFTDDESEPEKPSQNHNSAVTEPATGECAPRRSKRNHCWTADLYGDFEDTSPVVRSKRGRCQVLPYKYRDSILEPLTRFPRHRSTTVPSKRRSR